MEYDVRVRGIDGEIHFHNRKSPPSSQRHINKKPRFTFGRTSAVPAKPGRLVSTTPTQFW